MEWLYRGESGYCRSEKKKNEPKNGKIGVEYNVKQKVAQLMANNRGFCSREGSP